MKTIRLALYPVALVAAVLSMLLGWVAIGILFPAPPKEMR